MFYGVYYWGKKQMLYYTDVSRGVLLLVKINKKLKNLQVILNELSPNTMSNTTDKYI